MLKVMHPFVKQFFIQYIWIFWRWNESEHSLGLNLTLRQVTIIKCQMVYFCAKINQFYSFLFSGESPRPRPYNFQGVLAKFWIEGENAQHKKSDLIKASKLSPPFNSPSFLEEFSGSAPALNRLTLYFAGNLKVEQLSISTYMYLVVIKKYM